MVHVPRRWPWTMVHGSEKCFMVPKMLHVAEQCFRAPKFRILFRFRRNASWPWGVSSESWNKFRNFGSMKHCSEPWNIFRSYEASFGTMKHFSEPRNIFRDLSSHENFGRNQNNTLANRQQQLTDSKWETVFGKTVFGKTVFGKTVFWGKPVFVSKKISVFRMKSESFCICLKIIDYC